MSEVTSSFQRRPAYRYIRESDKLPTPAQRGGVPVSAPADYDRKLAAMLGLPDVTHTKEALIRSVPFVHSEGIGGGAVTYIVQTFRMREEGDTIFLEFADDQQRIRLALPAAVADCIARQRDQLTSKVRSKVSRDSMALRMARGEKPGFLRGKARKS